ncbi:MAG: PilZ domain-containing protein [Myxococcota bacterium]
MKRPSNALRIEFETEETFRNEYNANISKGGIFIAGPTHCEVRDLVRVELILKYCQQHLVLDGEIVHRVSSELATSGATPGVAVHFNARAKELAERFRPYVQAGPAVNEKASGIGRRRAPRAPARTPALLRTRDQGLIEARCRDLSLVGALISLYGDFVPTKQPLKLWLGYPSSGMEMEVNVRVMRQLENEDGEITALGLEFLTSDEEQEKVTCFIAEVCAAEHSRSMGSIQGSISKVGVENLLQMFGQSTPQGTFTAIRGTEEGFITFEKGQLCAARLGLFAGIDALAEMLTWSEGKFEFRARVDWDRPGGASLPLDAAIVEAMRLVEEKLRHKPPRFSPEAHLAVVGDAMKAARSELSKAEEAVVVLAEVGMTVGKVMEVIPEPRSSIARMLGRLVERGLIRIQE